MAKLWFPEEGILRKTILPDLDKGRKDWDRPHTETVVYWVKRLLKHIKLDPKVMITAAYAHDWGYVGMFPDRDSYESVQAKKADHMRVGAEKIRFFLTQKLTQAYSKKQIARVAHLVGVHDKLDQLHDDDEIAEFESRAKKIFATTVAGSEGLEIHL